MYKYESEKKCRTFEIKCRQTSHVEMCIINYNAIRQTNERTNKQMKKEKN